jgi:hypothetical protein
MKTNRSLSEQGAIGTALHCVLIGFLAASLLLGLLGCDSGGTNGDERTAVPSTPGGLEASSEGGKVSLSWDAVTGAETYNVYRDIESGVDASGSPLAEDVGKTTFIDQTVENGKTYYYAVTSVNAAGTESPESEETNETLCISSGTGSAIQSTLGEGQDAVLCQGAEFDIRQRLSYTEDGQSIYTERRPTGEDRAVLEVDAPELATVIRETEQSDVTLRSVIVDGARPEYGYMDEEALLIFGGNVQGATIENVRAKSTRSWSTLHLPRWGRDCRDITVRDNAFGPAGTADGKWADGISLACQDSEVVRNRIVDATDGGIVIFGAAGSTVRDNTIVAENRVLLGGINMVDYGNDGIHSDYSGTTVVENTIDADGALIKIALGMRPSVWNWCHRSGDRNRRGTVQDNVLEGSEMGYGFVVDGVEGWTVTGNIDNSSHVGAAGTGCGGNEMPKPKGFLINRGRSEGTFQESFQDPGLPLHGDLELQFDGS